MFLGGSGQARKGWRSRIVCTRSGPVDTMSIGAPITTAEGGTFTIDTSLAITDARGRTANITSTDTLASNGVIHVVDTVLTP